MITAYKADFEIECSNEFCGRCGWRERKHCCLFNTRLKVMEVIYEMPALLRCKTCITFCANMPMEERDE
jgi:hypothetical protein